MDTYRYDDCSYVWNIPTEDRCRWVKETKDCFTDSVIQYTEILFCSFGSENTFLFTIGLMIMVIWLLYLFLILGTTADTFFHFLCLCSFCPSLAVIASVLQLSDNIAGVTILAFGNGAPDIFTSLVSGTDEGIIMFTELIGAGVFVTAIIAGSVAVVKPFRVLLKPLMRDACFYIVAICWISYVVKDGTVHLWEAISFVLCYLLFISLVVIMQIYENREERLKSRIPSVPDPDILRTYLANKDKDIIPRIPVKGRAVRLRTKMDIAIAVELGKEQRQNRTTLPEEVLVEDVDRPKGLFKEFLYDINPIGEEDWTSANRFVKFILIIRSPVMLLLQLFIPLVNMTTVKRGWTKLLNCFQLCVTPTLSLFLLNDLISNVAIARQGFPRMGYAACFGGPMFNTLLGLGLTYGMAASKQPEHRTNMRMSDMAPGCFCLQLYHIKILFFNHKMTLKLENQQKCSGFFFLQSSSRKLYLQ
ncbi:mitochondrial sodium/calcium exchanger protein [Bombus fervidus]|uniref:mitochondrial sodium/calcium exchanger protein n=1 Tax=Bombus fervidus TaxID=203811 RepID=UPI003AB44E36